LSFCRLLISLRLTSCLLLCPKLTDAPYPGPGTPPPFLLQNGVFIHRVRTLSLPRVQDNPFQLIQNIKISKKNLIKPFKNSKILNYFTFFGIYECAWYLSINRTPVFRHESHTLEQFFNGEAPCLDPVTTYGKHFLDLSCYWT
jgi:hypothetical protein